MPDQPEHFRSLGLTGRCWPRRFSTLLTHTRPLGLFACVAGLCEISDRPTCLAVLPATAAGLQVGPGLLGSGQSGFGLAQGGGPIRQVDAPNGVACHGCLGVEQGGEAGLLLLG